VQQDPQVRQVFKDHQANKGQQVNQAHKDQQGLKDLQDHKACQDHQVQSLHASTPLAVHCVKHYWEAEEIKQAMGQFPFLFRL
jgi:hypothetical protein